jgi:YVTN family beta-propeller protein
MGHPHRLSAAARGPIVAAVISIALPLGFVLGVIGSRPWPTRANGVTKPTYSSPIAMSQNEQLVWVVNPDDDSVSVIRTDTNQVITKIAVGDEPQGVALDPNNQFAYVANAAANTVTVIKITNASPDAFQAAVDTTVGQNGHLTTGAEPWNIVASPDGNRIFVANSGQDTVTVIDATTRAIIGHVNLRDSLCNDPDRQRHFQPRGLAVTQDNTKLYVTRFLSFTKTGGRQGADDGREGAVCRLDINTGSSSITDYQPAALITLAPQITGFKVDANINDGPGDGVADDTSAFPNQLQSIVIRGDRAYLPNIAASPTGPLVFNVSTHAFVNQIGGVNSLNQTDLGALNLHLGAPNPEPGKITLFFANPWAIAFTNQSGAGNAYAVSAGSDLLVKLNVAGDGTLSFTVDANTTRYIDLNDPDNAGTSGANAGKNPRGIVINDAGTRAYVTNFVSRNVSVVDLSADSVAQVIPITPLPTPGSQAEIVQVGAEMFFSTRGHFDRPGGATVPTDNRLAQAGWQGCASCHFEGWTDGVNWAFATGPRKSVPLNATFNPRNPNDQRVLNYSAIFDEVEDFEANIRNISGPGNDPGGPQTCSDPPPDTSLFRRTHGLLIGDNGDINLAPCVINAFAKANAGRPQLTVTLPGSGVAVPALTALREWVRFAIRTPNSPLTDTELVGGVPGGQAVQGRILFQQAGCTTCHGGEKWTVSTKDFVSPPAAAEIATETNPAPTFGNPVGNQYLSRFLRDIGSFNLGVPGQGNPIGNNIGAKEKATAVVNAMGVTQAAPDALGRDYNGDGKGIGYNVPSLLGIHALPPFIHNGACETLACVVGDVKHRTANGTQPDGLPNPEQQAAVVKFLETLDVRTPPFKQFLFVDVPENHFARAFIQVVFDAGVTSGCSTNPAKFCPDDPVTREQMAAFLLRSKAGPGFVPPACIPPGPFADVPCSNIFAGFIQELVARGITAGCTTTNYCPNQSVTRAEMSVFLLKTREGGAFTPPACIPPGPFADVPCSNIFAGFIQELAARGITAGCTTTNYCPNQSVTRAEMSVFLVRTFNLGT